MTTIIAILIALGMLGSPEEFNNLDESKKSDLIEIVIMDEVMS